MKVLICVFIIFTTMITNVMAFSTDNVSAESFVLIEAKTGRVIAQKNLHKRMPMASTTKIMTSLIALEQADIFKEVNVSRNAITVEGTSMGLQAGERVNLLSLAYGMLLSSGNDAANVAAMNIGGSIEQFSRLMNDKAREIGMMNTSFITPSGLDATNHYSTAFDMALLGVKALQNPYFAEIVSLKHAKLKLSNNGTQRYFTNHNRLLKELNGTVGIKTGFTKKAGRCLVSAVTRNDITLVCVTLNAPNDWADHKGLYELGFKVITPVMMTAPVQHTPANVVGGEDNTVKLEVIPTMAGIALIDKDKITTQMVTRPFFYAPIKKGDSMGEVIYSINGKIVATAPIVAYNSVDIKNKIQ